MKEAENRKNSVWWAIFLPYNMNTACSKSVGNLETMFLIDYVKGGDYTFKKIDFPAYPHQMYNLTENSSS